MKKLILLAGLGLLGPTLVARAQVFRPGLLVRVQGDTLRGEVEDAAWDEEPQQVRLRPGPGSEVTTYPAAALQSLKVVDGQYYRRTSVPIDRQAQTDVNQLQEGLLIQQKTESLLAEVLVDGPGQLLYTAVGNVRHYFVQRPGQPWLELSERKYLRRQDGRLVVAEGNNYRASLRQYFGDCPAAVAAVGTAAFTQDELVAVVQTYNQQCGPTRQLAPSYLAKPAGRRVSLNLGLVAGARYASSGALHGTQAGQSLEGTDLDGQVHPVGGAYLDVLLPGRRSAIHVAGLLATYGRDGLIPPIAPGFTGSVSGRQTILEIRLGGRFFQPVGHGGTQLLAGAGVTLPYRISSTSPTIFYSMRGAGGTLQATAAAPYTYPTSRLLPYLEVGVRQKRLALLLDGRLGDEQTYYDVIPPNSQSYNDYTLRPWYVGLTLELSLLRQR